MECLKHSIYNLVINFESPYFFYFDNNGVYQKNRYDELPKDINLSLYQKYKCRNVIGSGYINISFQYIDKFIKNKYTIIGAYNIYKAIKSLEIGSTVEHFDDLLYNAYEELKSDPVFFHSKVNINKELIKNIVILRKFPYVYYFNSDGIFTRILEEECMLKIEPYVDAPASELITFPEWFSLERPEKMHVGRFRRAISSAVLKGESVDSFEDMINGNNFTIPFRVNNVNDFITSITRPSFERRPENKNQNTFDFIRVYVNFCSMEDYKKYIKKNLKPICRIVLRKIDESKAFKKYGVPINFLKLTSAIICVDKSIELVFELKDLEK